jgi:hypothetical protein
MTRKLTMIRRENPRAVTMTAAPLSSDKPLRRMKRASFADRFHALEAVLNDWDHRQQIPYQEYCRESTSRLHDARF